LAILGPAVCTSPHLGCTTASNTWVQVLWLLRTSTAWCIFDALMHRKEMTMARQSITLSQPNDEWLQQQVSDGAEYGSKSELINELIRNARRAEALNQKLAKAEQAGFTNQNPAEMLQEFRQGLATDV
jgi:antitoxin ParD1/3/4